MILVLKILAVSCLGYISHQDFKERAVYWFLFPITATLFGFTHYLQAQASVFGLTVLTNIVLITLVLLILFSYTKFILNKRFLNTSFGLGDLMFFYAFSLGFPTVTFLVLFVCSIFFSLLYFIAFKQKMVYKTVPLAGLQSLFLIVVLIFSILIKSPSLYYL